MVFYNYTNFCNEQVANANSIEFMTNFHTQSIDLIPFILVLAVPLFLFLIFGAMLKSGKSQAITKPNFWILFLTLFISELILALLYIFPYWHNWKIFG